MAVQLQRMATLWRRVTASLSPFSRACVLSLVLHAGLLWVLGLLLWLFEAPSLQPTPLVFDFVFAPAEEPHPSGTTALTTSSPTRERPTAKPSERAISGPEAINLNAPGFGAAPEPLPLRADRVRANADSPQEEFTPPAATGAGEHAEVSQPAAAPVLPDLVEPESGPAEVLLPAAVLATAPPRDLIRPRADLVPARVPMTYRQRKELYKKVKKLAENLARLHPSDSLVVWKHKGQAYEARIRRFPGRSETDLEEVVVEISTREDGYALASEVRMKRLAFSNFAQFVDYWDPRVAAHDDVLDGRFHSNTRINISASFGIQPQFRGKVTTASYEVGARGSPFLNQKSVFLGGVEFGVKEIRLPKKVLPFLDDSTLHSERTHRLSQETYITFHRDGTYTWYSKEQPDQVERRALGTHPFYILGLEKKTLHVKGVVNGQVLVYSRGKIMIDDDLTYARHPKVHPNSDDYLGLVSDKDVEIAHPSVTGPGDLLVFAAVYARGRFRVKHLYRRPTATLYLYGSLTAGSLSATEPRYATRIEFDPRLEETRPPSFPVTDRYEITEWDATWRVKP